MEEGDGQSILALVCCLAISYSSRQVMKFDLAGRTFGKLKITREVEPRGVHRRWECRCACGRVKAFYQQNLLRGLSQSCGCARKGPVTHGASNTPEYQVWLSMRRRCEDPKATRYSNYGGRGICVCVRWQTFENFIADMGSRPSSKEGARRSSYSIERINNDGNYEPNNCVWATHAQQGTNKRTTRFITIGDRTMTLTEWSKASGVPITTIWNRLNAGWSAERAVR